MSYGKGAYSDPYGSRPGSGNNSSAYGNPGSYAANQSARSVFQSDKSDQQLAEHIKKALANDEVAPKQKHVRECILYTWDMKGSGSLWLGLKGYPMYGDEIVTFKGLILVHKVINGGHPRVRLEGPVP
ncbi:ANTH domain-containing protein [Obelidium mucronatum]|nr:ANTH domain-containing protein [Obelidium mucronatum]